MFKKRITFTIFILLCSIQGATAASLFRVHQGDVLIIPNESLSPDAVLGESGEFPKALYCEKGACAILIAIDMKKKPGTYDERMVITVGNQRIESDLTLEVVGEVFPEQKLTLPKKYVEPDKETQERIAQDNLMIRQAFAKAEKHPVIASFKRPLKGAITTRFGMQRVLNGQPRNQHTGVDIHGERGEIVRAAGTGRVVLVGDFFYNGKSVFIDHGGALFSMYFHLDRIDVKEGDEVTAGSVVGAVGSTGRSTGPHLHFGMRLGGAAIDPLRFIEQLPH